MVKFKTKGIASAAATVALSAVLFGLAGCSAGAGDAESQVRDALDVELSPIAKLEGAFVDAAAAAMDEDFAEYGIDPIAFVEAYFEGFDYEVGAVQVDGERATAEVAMECKSVMEYTVALQGSAMGLAEDGSLEGSGSEDVAAALGEVMLSAWDSVEASPCDPVTVSLELVDGQWAVSADSESAILDVLLNH